VQVGLRVEALHSRTFWLCTNCYSCTIRCPRGIALTETMAALKRLAIAEGVKGKDKDNVSAFYRAFVTTVRRHGRNHEAEFLVRYFMSTNPLAALKFGRMGLELWLRGRVPLVPKEPKDKQEIETIFRASLEVEKAALERAATEKAQEVHA
jgi:heterodisulfide reductase subunit C2